MMKQTPRAPAGFTLIELLVVIAIIGLLISIVSFAVVRQREAGRITECRARLTQIGLLLATYQDRMGDVPSSRLVNVGVKEHNRINEGAEALVVALKAPDYAGRRPEEGWLGNTDGDKDERLKLADGSKALLELLDPWDDPIVYIANSDYDDDFVYRFGSGAAAEDVTVRAAINPLTGAPHEFEGYQLRSAGPDGFFDTDDDIANYEIPRDDG
ncbi:MAG: prepilin-type N-terminal cleavage/methylation domain-containing protein [Planctomycetota bacterium]|jgi:prepilin-type N-terminal cleavage/methylation domain-containing protein